MTGRLAGKVALVTGSAHGMGRSHAVVMAEHGADIALVDRAEREIEPQLHYPLGTMEEMREVSDLIEARDRRCLINKVDARDFQAVADAFQRTVHEFGKIDIVVINHGILHLAYAHEIPEEMWDLVLDVNLKSVWNVARAAIPHLKANQGGSMVIVSSTAGIRGHVGYAHYVASKHGVVGLARALANELAPWRIRVNTVHPTAVGIDPSDRGGDSVMNTRPERPVDERILADPMMQLAATNRLPDYNNPYEDASPVVFIDPEDISNGVVFLASDESRYITGQQLVIDAGSTLKP
jgi:NAD(P)-dependent dehydrogenase (short-subunit alcohol dehydrogenase family)